MKGESGEMVKTDFSSIIPTLKLSMLFNDMRVGGNIKAISGKEGMIGTNQYFFLELEEPKKCKIRISKNTVNSEYVKYIIEQLNNGHEPQEFHFNMDNDSGYVFSNIEEKEDEKK